MKIAQLEKICPFHFICWNRDELNHKKISECWSDESWVHCPKHVDLRMGRWRAWMKDPPEDQRYFDLIEFLKQVPVSSTRKDWLFVIRQVLKKNDSKMDKDN